MDLLRANENHCLVQKVDLGSVWHDDGAQRTVPYPPDSRPAGVGGYDIDSGATLCPLSDDAWTCRSEWSGLSRGELPQARKHMETQFEHLLTNDLGCAFFSE